MQKEKQIATSATHWRLKGYDAWVFKSSQQQLSRNADMVSGYCNVDTEGGRVDNFILC